MKSITISNLQIQFDSFDQGADKHTALNMIADINDLLQTNFPENTPQIFSKEIDDNDIEIADQN